MPDLRTEAGEPSAGREARTRRRFGRWRATRDTEDDFPIDLKRRLGLLRREIDSLRRAASTIAETTRGDYLDVLSALQRRVDRLERRVEAQRAVARETWRSFCNDAEATWRELKRDVQATAVSFRQRFPADSERPESGRPRR